MKFTVIFATIMSISWAMKLNQEDKGKREAAIGYGFPAAAYSRGHDSASAVSIGAGYSIGGKPYSFASEDHGQQLSSGEAPSGHSTIQLAPITLQPSHGNQLVSGDLSQLMKELSQGLNSGQLTLSPYQEEHGSQNIAGPQYSFSVDPKHQQYAFAEQHGLQSAPSYAAGTKGLGSYSSTGPVLFSQDSQATQPAFSYGAPSHGGQSLGDSGALAFAHLSGLSSGDSGHQQLSSGHGLAGLGGFGGHGISLSNGHSLKGYGGHSGHPKISFKPSAYLGGDSSHAISSLSSVHSGPTFQGHSLSGGHGLSLGGHSGAPLNLGGHGHSFGSSHGLHSFVGSSKGAPSSYLSSKVKYSPSLSGSSGEVHSSGSHGPPRTTYGVPTASHAASSYSPKYFVSSSKYFGDGSKSFGGHGHGHISSLSSGPKYSFGSHSSPLTHSSHYAESPKDIEGSYSENTYNTIKYSAELKPVA